MQIKDDEIQIWFCEVDILCKNPELVHLYSSVLSEEENAHALRFRFDKHRRRYILTRALIRYVLSLYFPDISAKDWHFLKNEFGKPRIANSLPNTVYFNISHTDEFVIIAFCNEESIGIDIENVKRKAHELQIAKGYFTDDEVAYLEAASSSELSEKFFSLWTLKEAYLKAIGLGLSKPMHQISFSFEHDKIHAKIKDEKTTNKNWFFTQFEIDMIKDHIISLAIRKDLQDKTYVLKVKRYITPQSLHDVDFSIVYF